MKSCVYFDMDGVLCDWEAQFTQYCELPLEQFSSLPREERNKIKESFVSYEFFRTMKPIQKGLDLLKSFLSDSEKYDVVILSATGTVNLCQVVRAKEEWIREFISPTIEVLFVNKVEQKSNAIKKDYVRNILVDDRQVSIDAWTGDTTILFKKDGEDVLTFNK